MNLDNFENILREKANAEILYITKSGSSLYGTDNENSDSDYVVIYKPNFRDLIFGSYEKSFSHNTSKEKNSKDDIDIYFISVQEFFDKLNKGDTNSIEILFSFFSRSVIYYNNTFYDFVTKNYNKLFTNNYESLYRYYTSQNERFGGIHSKYSEVLKMFDFLWNYKEGLPEDFLDIVNEKFKDFKHINIIDGSLVVDKMKFKYLSYDVLFNKLDKYLEDRLSKIEIHSSQKGLYHFPRISLMTLELLETNFIKFPFVYADTLKKVKRLELPLSKVIKISYDAHQASEKLKNNEIIYQDKNKVFELFSILYKLI